MSSERPPTHAVPTLTEVVQWPNEAPGAIADSAAVGAVAGPGPSPVPSTLTDEELTQRVLVELERQIDLMLDYRLREMLTPLLARAADGLIRDTRHALASTLREVVARAVAQELSRHRIR